MEVSRLSVPVALGLMVMLLLTGCSSSPASTTSSVLTDDFEADIEIEIVLTVKEQSFTLQELSSRPTSTLEVLEPFTQEDTSFEVIDFGQLLLESGFAMDDRIKTIAINDYRFSDSVQNFVDNKAYLAISENGKPIPIAKGGPIRIVFEDSSGYYPYLEAWNWSLRSIKISGD